MVILGFIALIAVLMFAGILPGGIGPMGSKKVDEVVLWGPYGGNELTSFFSEFNAENSETVKINYVSKTPETFLDDLIESFARGEGPDLFFVDQTMLNRLNGKITEIPYSSYPQRDILNNFVDGASVFMNTTGLRAMPMFIDPLVMYYNRTMYTSANIIIPPKNWIDLIATIKPITEIDQANNITRTAVALGQFNNITNAKYILSTLLFQAGNPIIATTADNNYEVVLANNFGLSPTPAEVVVSFFNQFSNPTQEAYAWNRSISQDKDMFVAEKLATYFGFASELTDLQAKNPHLNFDAALIPQKDSQKKIVYGDFYGLAISKSSSLKNSAILASSLLSNSVNNKNLASLLSLRPIRRDLLVQKESDPFLQVFNDSAVVANSWVDPNTVRTNQILQSVIENTQTGQVSISSAVINATSQINLLFDKFISWLTLKQSLL